VIVGAVMAVVIALRLFWVGGVMTMPPDLQGLEGRGGAVRNGGPVTYESMGTTVEAAEFLNAPNARVASEQFTSEQLYEVVVELRSRGARRVVFAGIEMVEGQMVSSWLVVEMPLPKPMRTAVLELLAEISGEPEPDYGQELVGVTLE
jgi:hypothetical protein